MSVTSASVQRDAAAVVHAIARDDVHASTHQLMTMDTEELIRVAGILATLAVHGARGRGEEVVEFLADEGFELAPE